LDEGEESASFLKKRSKKLFPALRGLERATGRWIAPSRESFWFFFSKKKVLPFPWLFSALFEGMRALEPPHPTRRRRRDPDLPPSGGTQSGIAQRALATKRYDRGLRRR
jgi:hypothetical protein